MMNESDVTPDWPNPWPIESLIERLQAGQNLYHLVRSRQKTQGYDVRENILEDIVRDVMAAQFGSHNVTMRKQIGTVLDLRDRPFPARKIPDLCAEQNNRVHVLEVKSSRTDYSRFDRVFDSRPFKQYLESVGDAGKVPWEVEQDLIKLHLYKSLSPRVGSCLFIMVDAYEGPGHSWTNIFSSRQSFLNTMDTSLVKGRADNLRAATRIETFGCRERVRKTNNLPRSQLESWLNDVKRKPWH